MKIKSVFFLFIFIFFLRAAVYPAEQQQRGLFVSAIQEPGVLSSRSEIIKLIDFSRRAGINTLFVQVYRANRSWFASSSADQSPYRACLASVGEDPLALLVRLAHREGIKVHAWMNLLSLSANKEAPMLKKYGNSILTRNLKAKNYLEDYKIDDQYFLEPGDPRVSEELEKILEELLGAYPGLDGVLFDYIRYPDKNPAYGYTDINTERFKRSSGLKRIAEDSSDWKEWKRVQVTAVLERLTKRARLARPGIQVGATGCAPYVRAYYEAFQDWPSWLEKGLVDSVTVMTYASTTAEFEKMVLDARKRVKDFPKISFAVGAYALAESPGIFAEELGICDRLSLGGYAILHYGVLAQSRELSEILIKK